MSKKQALQELTDELHLSHSQIFTFLTCGLKYRFQYIERRQIERRSVALPFGSAIHTALERYYCGIKNKGGPEPLAIIQELFEDSVRVDLEHTEIPLVFKKSMPDTNGAVDMGKAMLKAFYETVDLSGMEIIDVELPLSATLYTEKGEATDLKLIGAIDLLLRDETGQIVAVDHKTAARAMAQATADEDNQMTAYAYLLASNRYVFPASIVKCRFDVLRKLKTPKFEHCYTERTPEQRKRFSKIAKAVLAGIEAGIFLPQFSWMCTDCGFMEACKAW